MTSEEIDMIKVGSLFSMNAPKTTGISFNTGNIDAFFSRKPASLFIFSSTASLGRLDASLGRLDASLGRLDASFFTSPRKSITLETSLLYISDSRSKLTNISGPSSTFFRAFSRYPNGSTSPTNNLVSAPKIRSSLLIRLKTTSNPTHSGDMPGAVE